MKKVSVIIPVYKVEKYIAATVESVLKQTYTNFELIIVDDGSPDRSIEICQRFKDPRIKIIRQENQGVCAARNTGIRNSQGECIAFLDGDDLWLKEKLEKHIEHLESLPEVGISFSRSAFIDEAGELTGTYLMPKLKEITPAHLLLENVVGNGSAAVIRKEVIEAIRFSKKNHGVWKDYYFDEDLHHLEDGEFWLRIAIQTDWLFEGISAALTLYRVNPEGASTNLLKQFESLEQVIEKTRSYAPELIANWEKPAKAYNLRILARSAIRLRAGAMAMQLIHRALATYWRIILEEPRRTVMTLIVAYVIYFLPRSLYCQVENLISKFIAATQKNTILRDQIRQSV